ncbi:MAG: glycerol-3-phosphate acyltransferase [Acidimicrobiales bacterium]
MLALVEDVVGRWVPSGATWVGIVAGPLVVAGYLVGSVPVGYLWSRRRLRRQLDDPALASARVPDPGPAGMGGGVGPAVTAGLATLLVSTLAWDLALAATPTTGTFSAVGIFSNQAIGAWVSVALWTGWASVVGHMAPVWTGFRGGSGVPPAVAVTAAYAPLVLVVGTLAFGVGYALTRQPRGSLLVALPVATAGEYLAWLVDLQGSWGVTNGPELTLWTAVVAATVAVGSRR